MAKLVYILFLILIVSVCSNDIVDLIRCIYQNFVPNIQLIFELIDAIKAQNWMTVITKVSAIIKLFQKIIPACKAKTPALI